jgi:hypothetical protein
MGLLTSRHFLGGIVGGTARGIPHIHQKFPQIPLTDSSCKNAKRPEGKARERFTDSGGLYLEVVPTDGKHLRGKYRYGGKEKRMVPGSYPALARTQRATL